MILDPLLLSRIQFGFTVSFHSNLAAWHMAGRSRP